MDGMKWISILVLILGTSHLCRILPSTFAFESPLLTATTCLVTLGLTLIVLGQWLRKDRSQARDDIQYELLSSNVWQELCIFRTSQAHARQPAHQRGARRFQMILLLLVAAICLRIQFFVRILASVECSTYTLEPLVSFPFAAADYWSARTHKQQVVSDGLGGREHDHDSDNRDHQKAFRRLFCAALVSVASIITLVLARSPASTVICPVFLNPSWLIPAVQLAGTATDVLIIYCITKLLSNDESVSTRCVDSRLKVIGESLLGAALICATILLFQSIVYYYAFATPPERMHMFEISASYVASTVELNLTLLISALCAIVSLLHADATTITLICTFTALCTLTIPFGWNAQDGFIPKHARARLFTFGLATIGFGAYFFSDTALRDRPGNSSPLFRKRPVVLYLGLLILFLTQFGIWITGPPSYYHGHRIQALILSGQGRHAHYLSQAATSNSLPDAVTAYKRRYARSPPPGFEHWYEYAVTRSSVIIDDFDSIDRDLLPFRALTPEQIRERTWRLMSNPSYDASGIMVRNGILSIAPNVSPTHRWMLEGIVSMIKPFAEWLPDMDLAFNVNDEPRVAVPYEVIEPMRLKAAEVRLLNNKTENSFSTGRAQQWKPIPEQAYEEDFMTPSSGRNTFQEFGSVGCPPNSPARFKRLWDVSRLCTACVRPHSEEAFVRDWELAGNVCHQPDLANLHGLYISPASFKGTNELYPVFSQSKAHGFNDILYPSAWNYLGKSQYRPTDEFPDVTFTNKNSTIYWRGMATEGLSHYFGHWKGMSRQRFIHLTNDAHHRSPAQPLLIANDPFHADGSYRWINLPNSKLQALISASVKFVTEIAHCNGLDCIQQEHEFAPLATRSPFQEHWQYKYLLDLDGAGFSGRFLPFLRSRSLPFKAALYREWWDDRVHAWHHFVPLDLRGHGFWATLAYFAGWDGPLEWKKNPDGWTKDGKELIRGEARDDVAQQLAENGREWARVALRKEDMEIYMFRLLLEWGRLTDDRRDEIGFEMD